MELIEDKYEITNIELGEGGFAKVYLGINKLTGEKVAIKKVFLNQKKTPKNELLNKLSTEIQIMQQLDHPNIVKLYDVYKTDDYWYIIMEYCDAGTLARVIEYNESSSKTDLYFNREQNTYYYLNQLINALEYIINLGYIHRDIKPMNVLLVSSKESTWDGKCYNFSQKLIVKLGDFGLAREFSKCENELMKSICGSPAYMAPEILLDPNSGYDSKIDIWSFGIIMYQLLFGKHPNKAQNINHLKELLEHKRIEFNYNKNFSSHCYDLLKSLLAKNNENRIDWINLFEHQWFKYWNNYENNYNILIHNANQIKLEESISFPEVKDINGSNLTKINTYKKTEAMLIPINNRQRKNKDNIDDYCNPGLYFGRNSVENPKKNIFISPENIFPLNLSKFIRDDYIDR
ncbi:serine-threonine kinase [Acanthamoeba polyphaga moumouvirus]|uniref:Serine/Threonine kinase n=1 Tax=Acanthamoeba polyphaga moumouvirus TaxID=1269028 RepID=L7RCX6_9VIRU|nr:serine-threonine kinase [Acanthamoeba polyphaga moumouvirus]AGC02086.1 Serine/Threonine kinase [Acanthamoeba polyphaga moumouvirus]AQN68457.1 serine/threonine kinase [Saudi moumouvirus]